MGIITEKDFIERIKNFDEYAFKAGERADKSVLDSHDFRYVKSGQFKANLHVHTQYSDGEMSIKELLDLSEDMAAEQKARAVYENLIDLTDDQNVIGPLLWLRQREIVHYDRFKELFEYYEKKLKNGNNSFNKQPEKTNYIYNNNDYILKQLHSDNNNYFFQ